MSHPFHIRGVSTVVQYGYLACFVCLACQRIKVGTPELPRINKFITYFEITYVARTLHTAEWNVYKTEGPWTNNHLEG